MSSVVETRYKSPPECKLSSAPPVSPTFYQRLVESIKPLIIISLIVVKGVPSAIFYQLTNPSLGFFNPFKWFDLIHKLGFAKILAFGDEIWGGYKRPLVEQANGKVLEIGAGSGENLKYYNKDNVETLYALEPEKSLSTMLAENIVKQGFAEKSLLIPVGIDDKEKLAAFGVAENTFDTIVLVQVCCSLPNASAHFKYLQSLLKPGGKLVMFEHVASTDPLTRILQNIYTTLIWRKAALGCELNRASGIWMKELGGWEHVDLLHPEIEHLGTLLPHDIGVFTKASYANVAHD